MNSNSDDIIRRMQEAELKRRRIIRKIISVIEANSKKAAPAETGRLRRNIISFMLNRMGVVGVSIAAEHALAVHEGSGLYGIKRKKYQISPKHKKALSWPALQKAYSQGQAARPFVPKVMHPGVKSRPFLSWGLGRSKNELTKIVKDEGLEFIKDMT